jgi:predicted O-methyltransferase YrrM
MDITKRLQELDPTLILHNEGAWDKSLDTSLPGYTSFNDAGVETETGEFLYAMVRILKPTFVLETGTHWGIGSSYMAQALKDNNHGILDTIEFLPEIYTRACRRFEQLNLLPRGGSKKWIRPHLMDVKDFIPTDTYKLMLLDTEPQTRFAELIKFEPFLEPGGFVFIHDLHRHMHQIENKEHGFAWPYGKLPQEVKDLVNDWDLRPFHFGTPRGLTGFYKRHPDDFKAWDT